MGLIAEALGLRCKVLGLVGWNATLVKIIQEIRDNDLDDSKSTNRFSEQTYFNQEKEFPFVSF